VFSAGDPNSDPLTRVFLNGSETPPAIGLTNATVTVPVPIATGNYDVRFCVNDSFDCIASSATLAVPRLTANGASEPSSMSLPAGSTVSVNLVSGPGHPGDFIGVFATGSADGAYLSRVYLDGSSQLPATGFTTTTLPIAIPATPGSFEFRFCLNAGNCIATSAAINATTPTGAALPSISYAYDALGRLTGVTDASGNAATYAYDAVGNVLSITRSTASTVSISGLSPTSGAAGSAVSVTGIGFSTTPALNAVPSTDDQLLLLPAPPPR
jgi:YD repeat-containing protein